MVEFITPPTFHETTDDTGDVLLDYTEANGPSYPPDDPHANYVDLGEMHGDIADPSTNPAARMLAGRVRKAPVNYPPTATEVYLRGRIDILGDPNSDKI